ncbi:GYD domain-containing protein [Candidatus Bathyarchaeota archaeon]|nr:GYD domain-containing protein [Candidatus Bathyarchaeota archaeon]
MPDYLVQIALSPETIATYVAKPENREEMARSVIEKLGGKIKGFWYTLGDYDVVIVETLPDNVSAAAHSMVVTASGAFKHFKTTPLLSVNEGIEAMKKASKAGYKPPGK